jgi:plasmid stabilization system protein ParE
MAAESVEGLAAAERDLDALFAAKLDARGTADDFLEMVERALALLLVFPELGPVCLHPFRRYLLRDRNLGIFHTFEGRGVFVHALCDLRQDPAQLRRRLTE